MAYLLSNTCTTNYWNRTTIVEIIVCGWVVCFFETHVQQQLLKQNTNGDAQPHKSRCASPKWTEKIKLSEIEEARPPVPDIAGDASDRAINSRYGA